MSPEGLSWLTWEFDAQLGDVAAGWRARRRRGLARSSRRARVRPPAAAGRRCLVVSPMRASCAWTGAKRPTEGTKAKRRFSATKPQASRPMIAPTWLRTISAEADADRAPEGDPGERAEQEQRWSGCRSARNGCRGRRESRSRSRSRALHRRYRRRVRRAVRRRAWRRRRASVSGVNRKVGRMVP